MAVINGTNESQTIEGTNDRFDYIYGLGGHDIVYGRYGIDIIYGGNGNDTLNGNSGSDYIVGGVGKDVIFGGSGADTIEIESIADANGDAVNGGSGVDILTIDYSKYSAALKIAIKDWIGVESLPGGINVINVERFWLTGTAFADRMTGGQYGDNLSGGLGNDTLDGGGGGDTLSGDEGNDVLTGGAGWDILSGGAGKDKISGGSQGDSIYGGDGNDTLFGDDGDDRIYGDAGSDVIEGGNGNDTIEGGGGDTISGGNGDDSISILMGSGKSAVDGGSGSDRLTLSYFKGNLSTKSPNDVTTLADGTTIKNIEHYTIEIESGPSKITTGAGADFIQCDSNFANDTISSGAGNDTIYAGGGNDHVNAGSGDDAVYFGYLGSDYDEKNIGDVADGGAGTDKASLGRNGTSSNLTFTVNGSTATLTDGTILKNFESFEVAFGSGNDIVKSVGSASHVSFDGGEGNDKLIGGSGADNLSGGGGNDTIYGYAGNDTISEFTGTNKIDAGSGNDTVSVGDSYFEVGNHTVNLSSGDDTLECQVGEGYIHADGGTGTDTVSLDLRSKTSGFTVALSSDMTIAKPDITLKNFERLKIVGGDGADRFTGGSLDDSLDGGNGNDRLSGGDGNDFISGGGGSDTISAGAGDDKVYLGVGDTADGGSGTDQAFLSFWEQTKTIEFVFSTGTFKPDGVKTVKGFESLNYDGGSGSDKVTGSALSDVLYGNDGNDVLHGGSGRDTLYDGLGNDKLYGDGDNDFMSRTSEIGTDLFDGGAGTDTMSFANSSLSAIVDLLDQKKNNGAAKGATLVGIETIKATANDDNLSGDNAANWLVGGDGDDTLNGRGGDDMLFGGGSIGRQVSDDDWLTGGSGKDKFVLQFSSLGGDVITDFRRGEDKLLLDMSFYGMSRTGEAKLVLGTNPSATTSSGSLLFETDTSRLWFDADGTGDGEKTLVATLQGIKTLSTSDFGFWNELI